MKLSVIPTTYELPSAALATPSATSLPLTAPCRFCKQRLALNAANSERDRQNNQKESFHGLRYRFCVFVSLADIGRENKRAKGYQVVTLAE